MASPMRVRLRPLIDHDYERITWALYAAVGWDPQRRLPPFETFLQHPDILHYHDGWGRPGDMGVIAEVDGEFAGIAFCRLFTDENHGHGYLDAETPELALAVPERWRNRGIGTRLMEALAERAHLAGIEALSLSVETDNPARRLYERMGYREVSVDEGGVRMLFELGDAIQP